jgi:hypothetical protein
VTWAYCTTFNCGLSTSHQVTTDPMPNFPLCSPTLHLFATSNSWLMHSASTQVPTYISTSPMAATSQMQEPVRYPRRRRWPQKAGLSCLVIWHCYSYFLNFVIFQGIDLQQLQRERTSTSSLQVLDVPVVESDNAITEPRNRDRHRAATNEDMHEEEMSEGGSTAPVNIHKHYPLTCGAHVNISSLHPASFGLFEMAYSYTPNSTNNRGQLGMIDVMLQHHGPDDIATYARGRK